MEQNTNKETSETTKRKKPIDIVTWALLVLAVIVTVVVVGRQPKVDKAGEPIDSGVTSTTSSSSESSVSYVAETLAAAGAEAGANVEAPNPMRYINDELGFQVILPAYCTLDEYDVEISKGTANDEEYDKVIFVYTGKGGSASVLSLNIYSKELWEKVKAAEGPKPDVLVDGEPTVTLETLQSNPFQEGSEDYVKFSTYSDDIAVIKESFKLNN